MCVKAENLVVYTRHKIESRESMLRYRTSPVYFTRKPVLTYKNTSFLVLNMIKNSLRVELMDYFYQLNENIKTPSRNAFNLAREKISYLAFEDLFEKSCELAVDESGSKLYKGYRIFAIDGTSFVVGDLEKLKEYFGESTSVAGKAMCRISSVVDVINNCVADATVSPFNVGERALAIKQIENLAVVSNALYLFDRGYWSPKLVASIIKKGQKFLMRLASNVGKATVTDENGNPYDLRRYSFTLPSGNEEILLTNIPESEMSDGELADLYAKRWGIETKYLELKDRLQLDKFSGETVNIVLQDIYSTLYISNLVAFICQDADEIIAKKTEGKGYKYEQKANRTHCIAAIRRRFIKLLLSNDTDRQKAEFQRLVDDISNSKTYIGKSKPKPRNKRKFNNSRHRKANP